MTNRQQLYKLARTYLLEPTIWIYGVILIAAATASWRLLPAGGWMILVVTGWAVYIVEEYVTHVFVFHGWVPQNPRLYLLQYRLHLGHHDQPDRVDLLFTPLWYTGPMLGLNVAVFWMASGGLGPTFALTTGLVGGYLTFEWLHLLVHSSYQPGRIIRHVRKQHMGHHFWNEHRWYTISPPGMVLDKIFGTGGTVSSAPKSDDPERSGVAPHDPRLVAARKFFALHHPIDCDNPGRTTDAS